MRAGWLLLALVGCADGQGRPASTLGPSSAPRVAQEPVASPSASVAPAASTTSGPASPPSATREVLRFTPKSAKGPAYDAAFSQGDEVLATWCPEPCPWGNDQAARFVAWSLRDLSVVRDVVPSADDLASGRIYRAGFTGDGARYVTSTHRELHVWDAASWSLLGSESFGAIYGNWAVSRDGRHVVAADEFGLAALFDGRSGKVRKHLKLHIGAASLSAAVAWSGDDQVALVEGNGNVRTMRVDGPHVALSNALLDLKSDRVADVDLSRDGAWIAVVEGARVTMRATGGSTRHVLVDGSVDAHPPARLSFSPVHDRLVVIDVRGVARVFDFARQAAPASREIAPEAGGTSWFPRWSPDGRFVAWSGAADGSVAVWNAASGELRRLGQGGGEVTWSWSHQGKLLARAGGDSVEVWDVERGTSLRRFTALGQVSTGVEFSRDDRFVVAAAGDAHVVRIADGKTLVLRTRGIARSRASAALVADVGWAGDALLGREIERVDGAPGVTAVAADELSRDFFGR